MKSKTLLTLILSMIFLGSLLAQEEHSLGQAPGFVKSEKGLQHYRSGNILENTGYGVDVSSPAKFVSFPIPAGIPFSTVNNNYLYELIAGADIDDAGNYIGCTQINPGYSQLMLVDIDTGVPTLFTQITGFSYQAVGLAYNSSNSTWYFCSSNVSESRLYSINILNGSLTYIGQITGLAGLTSFAIDCNGNAFGIDIVTDQLFSINLSTGAGTPIGPLGFDANYRQDADFDAATNTLYLAAFNNGTFQAEFRSVDLTTGGTSFITAWPGSQISGFAIDNACESTCPVGTPSNPSPSNGATNVPINLNTASWTNGAGATNVEFWFGSWGYLSKLYDGPAISSYELPLLDYDTEYLWVIVCKDDNCKTQGQIWSFTTEAEPFPISWCDEFDNLSNWTVVGPQGLPNWSTSSTSLAGGNPPELQMSWTPSFNGESKIRSNVLNLANNHCCSFTFNLYFAWYADPSGIVTIGITYDGGITDTILYTLDNPTQNVGPIFVSRYFKSPSSGSQNCQIEIKYSGYSFNTDNIYWDNICLEYLLSSCDPPFAPSNLTAQVINNPSIQVRLNWEDNSQGEYGFIIYRKLGYPTDPGQFSAIDTVYNNITQYLDEAVIEDSTYSYFVSSFNQYGQNNSDTISIIASVPVGVEIAGEEFPKKFDLIQNYPNPFNPSTKIKYAIPASSLNPFSKGEGTFVTLKVYDILGNEVATLVNEEQAPGVYEVEFNAESSFRLVRNLTSGIYFYQLKAGEFVATKKMILLK